MDYQRSLIGSCVSDDEGIPLKNGVGAKRFIAGNLDFLCPGFSVKPATIFVYEVNQCNGYITNGGSLFDNHLKFPVRCCVKNMVIMQGSQTLCLVIWQWSFLHFSSFGMQ